jgi:Cu+-exporting ATPase
MTNSFTLKLPVYGMNCAGCASRLPSAFNEIKGIEAEVNFAIEAARINFDPEIDHNNTLNLIMSLLEQKGYQTDTETILLTAEGWNCANCSNTTSKMLNAQTLVLNAQANFATEKVQVQTIRGALKKSDIDTFSSLIPYTLSISSKQNMKAENVWQIKRLAP